MIHSVRANQPSFREVHFQPGFNVVLADATEASNDKDSRNGLGKSTLVEVLHFCLGAKVSPGRGLRVRSLAGWAFTVDLTLAGHRLSVTRATDRPAVVEVAGDPTALRGLSLVPDLVDGVARLKLADWCALLGRLAFDLPPPDDGLSYHPSFRSLIAYFARRGRDAFSDPFEHFGRQRGWDRQLHNAYLLGLNWQHAAEWQQLKDGRRALTDLRKAARAGLVGGVLGSRGELEADRVRLGARAEALAKELAAFRIHPEYARLENQASRLTLELHSRSNDNTADKETLGFYRESLGDVASAAAVDVAAVYAEAGVVLPEQVRRRLDEVERFQQQVVANRRDFLRDEVQRIDRAITERTAEIRRLDGERAEVMTVLEAHGALDEYSRLQARHAEIEAQVRDLDRRIADLDRIEDARGTLGVEQTRLYQRARLDYDERQPMRGAAIRRFDAHSQALYEAPGRLYIDLDSKTGYRFGVEIDGGGSEGIERMKVFCYDLTLAELWARRPRSPGFWVHDSTLFSGVDVRQRVKAIERAAAIAQEAGFQYICLLNSDQVSEGDFSPGFSLDDHVRLRLTDDRPEGSLLGFRVPPDEAPLTR